MDIRDVPKNDLRDFLGKNNVNYDDLYVESFNLIKEGAKYYPVGVIQWIKAYNLIKNKIFVPVYSIEDINYMNNTELKKLSNTLDLKVPNTVNIVQVLKYLHKLSNDKISTLLENSNYSDVIKYCNIKPEYCVENKEKIWANMLLRDFGTRYYSGDIIKYYEMLNVKTYGITLKQKNESLEMVYNSEYVIPGGAVYTNDGSWFDLKNKKFYFVITINDPKRYDNNTIFYVVFSIKNKVLETHIFTTLQEAQIKWEHLLENKNDFLSMFQFTENNKDVIIYDNYLVDIVISDNKIVKSNMIEFSRKKSPPDIWQGRDKILRICTIKNIYIHPPNKGTYVPFISMKKIKKDGNIRTIKQADYFDDNIYEMEPDFEYTKSGRQMKMKYVDKAIFFEGIPEQIIKELISYKDFMFNLPRIDKVIKYSNTIFKTLSFHGLFGELNTTPRKEKEDFSYLVAYLHFYPTNLFHYKYMKKDSEIEVYYGYIILS